MLAGLILAALLTADAPPTPPAAPVRELTVNVYLLPGAVPADRGPDGNTILFRQRNGIVVVDTGRHVDHSDAILAFAAAQHLAIIAIINTHWHLDHTSGNRRLKAVFPNAPVYATNAIDRALTGFLATNLASTRARIASGEASPAETAEAQLFFDTMDHAESLKPDIAVTRSQRMRIGGAPLDVHVTDHAVSDSDIWLYDRHNRIAVLGDLVTLPAPFFESACATRWREALDQVWATPFQIAVPGHGDPMMRAQFNTYRLAYDAFIDCAHGHAAATACAYAWASAVAPLMPGDERFQHAAAPYASYYVDMLRAHGGNSAECQKP